MEPQEIKILIKKRGGIKARITQIQTYVDKFTEGDDVNFLIVKHERLGELRNEYDEIQTRLEIHDEERDHLQDRFEFEEKYDVLEVKIRSFINPPLTIKRESVSNSRSSSEGFSKNGTRNSQSGHSNIKLPPIQIPTFSGSYAEWVQFKDTFECLIIKNKGLSDIQRFQYLLSALKGEAKKLIQSIAITEVNFQVAYDIICQRYENKKLIATQHVKSLLSLPSAQRNNVTELRQLVTSYVSNKNALSALQLPVPTEDLLYSQLLLDKISNVTRVEFENKFVESEFTTSDELCHFLEQKCQTLELVQGTNQDSKANQVSASKQNVAKNQHPKQSYVSTKQPSCNICKKGHSTEVCFRLTKGSMQERCDIVNTYGLCINCFGKNHKGWQCSSKQRCNICQGKHHEMMHLSNKGQGQTSRYSNNDTRDNKSADQQDDNVDYNFCSFKGPQTQSQVLLSTAIVNVRNSRGNLQSCRLILDNGSQSNFVTEDCVQRLRLKKTKQDIQLQGFDNLKSKATHTVQLEIYSIASQFTTRLNCVVLPKITGHLPERYIDTSKWNVPKDIQLADPGFNRPQCIDILVGAQVFMKILKMERRMKTGMYPVLQNTELGWILSGEYTPTTSSRQTSPRQAFFVRSDVSLDQQVQRFWEMEDIHYPIQTAEEAACEKHFKENTARNEEGRFVVKLPFKQDVNTLGESKKIATARLQHTERRLNKDPALKREYEDFLEEYETLGHMQKAPPANETTCYYMPHHHVVKESSTTKTRVVFDASCKTTNDISLNDILQVGPTIQQDLCSIILRFRTYQIAFIADINKMYRQIKVHPDNYDCQRILWRKNDKKPIQEYQLTTVTYGTASAPYLATKCLQQLANENIHTYPAAAEVLQRDFYVDDCISGTNNVQEAIKLSTELQELLDSGGFPLRKWATNNSRLLEAIPEELRENKHSMELDDSSVVKTLGLLWNPTCDQFQIVSGVSCKKMNVNKQCFTKRTVLGIIAAIFDPLGLISPIVIVFKMFLQQLWHEKLSWDEALPTNIQQQWEKMYSQLTYINEIKINRLVTNDQGKAINIQLHGFSDASEKAYGACVYVRTIDFNNKITVNLLCAKSKVTPLKKVTLPRLELCAAHLLSKLIKKVINVVNLKIDVIHLWTDSTIVVAWITGCPSRWKTFVANRVAEIQANTSVTDWNHVPSEENPADLISRGTSPQNLQDNSMWWHGPAWLNQDVSTWPRKQISQHKETLELRSTVGLTSTISTPNELIHRFSSFKRLQRVIAYCLRFAFNCQRRPAERVIGALSIKELQASVSTCIKIVQQEEYEKEIEARLSQSPLPKKCSIANLNPFLDKENVLRVGGRLQNSDLPLEAKHQAILPPKNHFTKLIIEAEHQRLLHAGPQYLITSLRQRYWIPKIRQTVKKVIHQCIPCFKWKARTTQQLMGNLPSHRITPARTFFNVGIDYAGPFLIKSGILRSKAKVKCYVAVFICLATRAIHLELVSDLTSGTFIAALRRFMARRGKPANIYSDNGTNFVGANNELHELYNLFQQENVDKKIANQVAADGCQWHFIPPNSPHFGGLWEAAVKSMKYHLRRTIGTMLLTFEEFTTILVQIEACLNSRPLIPVYDDHSEYLYLTPGHFLIGEAITNFPDPNLSDLNIHRLGRWQRIQQMTQIFWQRWSTEYLHSFQQRNKWTDQVNNVTPGTLVLVKEDNLPPLQWKVAVIDTLHPGTDGLVRVVTIRTSTGRYKRPIHKLCLFPQEEE